MIDVIYRFNPLIQHVWAKLLMPITSIAIGSAVSADAFVENQTNTALSAFYGFCLNDRFDPDRVPALADELGWERLSDEMMDVLRPTPEAGYVSYDGYMLDAPGDPPLPVFAFAGVSDDEVEKAAHCAFFFRDVLVSEFEQVFVEDTSADEVSDEKRIGQHFTFYTVPDFPDGLVLFEREIRNDRGFRVTFINREVAHD